MMTNNLDGPPDLDPDDDEPEPDLDISLAVLLETLAAPFSYHNDEERIQDEDLLTDVYSLLDELKRRNSQNTPEGWVTWNETRTEADDE